MAHFFFIFHALSFELDLFFDWRFPLNCNRIVLDLTKFLIRLKG